MDPDGDRLIRLPLEDTKANYLAGFWRWVDRLAADDYAGAIEGLHWPRGADRTPEGLKHQVTSFFGGDDPWSVVVPNDRLVGVIDDAAEFDPPGPAPDGRGWFRAMVPLTTEPDDPKDDHIPLMGLAASFFVQRLGDHLVMEFEIFHA